MEENTIGLILIIGGLLVGFCVFMAVRSYKQNVKRAENSVRNRIGRLGSLEGYTYNQIVEYIGLPNARQAIEGGMCCTWSEQEKAIWDNSLVGIYTISLIFDSSNICVGILSESYV